MIAVLMLISILVIVEEDYREIGVLKAVGLSVSHIKKLYMAKYGAIAGVACILGFLASWLLQEPLMEKFSVK